MGCSFGFFAILAIYWSADIAVQWQADPVLTSVKSTGTMFSFSVIFCLSSTYVLLEICFSLVSLLQIATFFTNPFLYHFLLRIANTQG